MLVRSCPVRFASLPVNALPMMLSQHNVFSLFFMMIFVMSSFWFFRRATCFGGGDDDDYDQEAGGIGESDRKYRKVGSSSVVRHCMSSVQEANQSAKLVVTPCSVDAVCPQSQQMLFPSQNCTAIRASPAIFSQLQHCTSSM